MRQIAIPLVLAMALAACGAEHAGTPHRPVEYTGEITAVEPFEPRTENCIEPGGELPDEPADEPVSSDDVPLCTDPEVTTLGTVLVEEDPETHSGDKIFLRIEPETLLVGAEGPIDFAELAIGDTVEAWVDGPVADSYPQQGRAEAVLVVAATSS